MPSITHRIGVSNWLVLSRKPRPFAASWLDGSGTPDMTQNKAASAMDGRALVWRTGAIAGIVGGIFYTLFIEAVNVVANGASAFFHPLRQTGAVVLGSRALDASYDLMTATAAGTAVHLAIAAAFGILIAWARARFAVLSTGSSIVLGDLIAGLALYALDVFVIFPAAFPWSLENSRLTQSIAHALFDAVTGAWLAWRHSA